MIFRLGEGGRTLYRPVLTILNTRSIIFIFIDIKLNAMLAIKTEVDDGHILEGGERVGIAVIEVVLSGVGKKSGEVLGTCFGPMTEIIKIRVPIGNGSVGEVVREGGGGGDGTVDVQNDCFCALGVLVEVVQRNLFQGVQT